MELKEAILHRRLIKPDDFNGAKIADTIIHEMLSAANWAPTHAHTEPWRFIVYTQERIKSFCLDHANLYKNHTDEHHFSESTYNKILHRVDLASHLIVCYTEKGNNKKVPILEETSAVSCAIQNLWLVATTHHVGLYWGTGGMVHHDSMKHYFQLQTEDVMMGLLFVGFTDKEWPKGKRNTSIDTKTKWIL